MDLNELAKSLFGKDKSQNSVSPGTTTTVYGTAVSDSENGEVQVFISDDAVGPDFGADPDATVITLPTSPSVKMGDTVAVTLLGGGAVKHPYVSAVIGSGDSTAKAAEMAQSAADAAEEVANRTQEHFWFVETGEEPGVHITEVPQEEWSDPDSENYHSGANQLSNSAGILLRDGLTNFAQLTPGEAAFYDGAGNAASNVVATFGTNGSVIGKTAESHAFIDYHSLNMVSKQGDVYFSVSDLRDSTGYATITELFTGDGDTTSYTVGFIVRSDATSSVEVEGVAVAWTRADKTFTLGSAPDAGDSVTITYQTNSWQAKAYTLGWRGTGRIGGMSTVEGVNNVASGLYSHAEGDETTASGNCSHAQNRGTIARGTNQTALGRFNVADPTSALIIGNGTSNNARSNALTVDWSGNVKAAADLDARGIKVSSTIRRDISTIDSTANPSARSDVHPINIYDANGILIGQLRVSNETDGRIGAGIIARQGTTAGGGIKQNRIMAYTDAAGNYTYSVTDPAAFRNALGASSGVWTKASGGTGKTTGLAWTGLGSTTNTGSITFNLTNYSEVCIAAEANGKLVTATIPKQLLTSTSKEVWLGGGKSSGATANSGNLRAVVNATSTSVTGVNFSEGSTNRTSSTTWRVYAR